jgi:hypothetical protein
MTRQKFFGVFCILSVCYIPVGSTPVAISKLTADLSKANINVNQGGSLTFQNYDEPLVSYMLNRSGMEVIEFPASNFPTGEDDLSASIPGASIYAQSSNGSSISEASASVSEGFAGAVSAVESYVFYKAENVSSLNLSLDVNALMQLSTETVDEFASGQWNIYLDLFYDKNGVSQLLSSDFYSDLINVSGLDNLSVNENHTLNVSYEFTTPYDGLLKLQSTLLVDAYAEVSTPVSVPEPSKIALMIFGLIVLLPLIKFRKA